MLTDGRTDENLHAQVAHAKAGATKNSRNAQGVPQSQATVNP